MKKELLKKIFLFVLFFLCTFWFMRIQEVNEGDELINFLNVLKMSNGEQIYDEAVVITTPLFHFIGLMVVKIFGETLFSFRLFNCVLYATLFLEVYTIFKKLKIRQIRAIGYILFLMFFYVGIILDGASYNILAMVLMLAGIINLMDSRSSKKKVIPQGILMFLIFYTKQNIGVYYIISVIAYELILNRHKKGTIWNLVKMGTIAAGFLMISIIVMNYLGILSGFINYAILGINEFKENIFVEKVWLLIVLALVWVFDIWGVIAHHTTKNMFSRKTKILLIFTIANILTIYPFTNEYHIKYGFFITILLAIYFFDKIVAKTEFSAKTMDKIIVIITIIGFWVTVNQVKMQCFEQVYVVNKYETIEGYGINKELYDNLIRYENYLETTDNKVLCLSKYSNFYSVIYKDFNGEFDILNLGNFGKDGVNGLIEKIKNMKNTEFVLYHDYNTQEPYELREFIKGNYKLKCRDVKFDVYYNE